MSFFFVQKKKDEKEVCELAARPLMRQSILSRLPFLLPEMPVLGKTDFSDIRTQGIGNFRFTNGRVQFDWR